MNFRFISSLSAVVLSMATSYAMAMEVDPEVMKALRSNSPEISVVVNLQGQYDLANLKNLPVAPEKRGAEVAKILESYTAKSAAPIVNLMANNGVNGSDKVTPLWITNSVRVKGPSAAIRKLLSANGIESIVMDAAKETQEFEDVGAELARRPNARTTSWGVTKVRAPELWEQNVDGRGIVVAMIDTGANLKHPDLAPNLWHNPGETGTDANGNDKATNGIDDDNNGFIDDVVGWNFEAKSNDPTDTEGHGSQTAGIVGGNGANGTQTGVAPGVKLMIVKSCCGTATKIFESNTWEAMQYAVKNGARVISMSLSAKPNSKPQYAKWRRASEVVLAAGVVHINSAGNLGSGNAPNNIGAPASNPPAWFHPKQPQTGAMTSMITIGATDQEDQLRSYSSTGPVTWEAIDEYKDFPFSKGDKSGLIKPDVCGPSEVPSTSMTGTGYTSGFGGTSSATPNVAGVAALLLSAKPNLTVPQVIETLQMSAVKVEDEFTNKCGAGRVDAFAAVEYARSRF